jgi:uncharacterized protein YjbJ (UPF0337 family)
VCRPFPANGSKEGSMIVNKDQVKGRVKEAAGKVKEVAGQIIGSEKLQVRGTVQKHLGEVQAKFGDIKQDIKESNKT